MELNLQCWKWGNKRQCWFDETAFINMTVSLADNRNPNKKLLNKIAIERWSWPSRSWSFGRSGLWGLSCSYALAKSVKTSVTRFGKISQLWPFFKDFGHFWGLILIHLARNNASVHSFIRRTPIDRIADWQNGVSVNLHWKHLTLDWQKVTSPEKFGQSSLRGLRWPNGAPAYWPKKVPN